MAERMPTTTNVPKASQRRQRASPAIRRTGAGKGIRFTTAHSRQRSGHASQPADHGQHNRFEEELEQNPPALGARRPA